MKESGLCLSLIFVIHPRYLLLVFMLYNCNCLSLCYVVCSPHTLAHLSADHTTPKCHDRLTHPLPYLQSPNINYKRPAKAP